MSRPLLLLLLVTSALPTWAQAPTLTDPSPFDSVPGAYQFAHADPVVGSLSLGGFVLGTASTVVMILGNDSPDAPAEYWVEKDGKHYFRWQDPAATGVQQNRWKSALAVTGTLWGNFFYSYGAWNTYLHTRASEAVRPQQTFSLGDYLGAPFQADQVFNTDVFPMLPLMTLGSFGLEDYGKIGNFFSRETVPFVGLQVNPWVGFGLDLATNLALVSANAALEELLFRGLLEDRYGSAVSSVAFASNHLLNAFALPNFSFEEAALQSLGAGIYGWYASDRTQANGGDFRKMIALHFWNNVINLTVAYLVRPENNFLF